MIKLTYIRDEDYWLFPLSIFAIIGIAITIYASAMSYRLPAAIVGLGLLWFTTAKVRSGYDGARAKLHAGIVILFSILLFLLVFILTN